MSLLTILSDVASLVRLPRPAAIVTSQDDTFQQLFAYAKEEVQFLRSYFSWVETQREYLITLVEDQDAYELPSDFLRFIPHTEYNRSDQWRLYGPLSPEGWQFRKSGVANVTIRQEFRVKGWNERQLYINPTPTSEEAGQILVFEYQSNMIVRPRDWVTNTNFAANACCWSNDKLYKTTNGGTTGATAPSHTTGTESDGGVQWTLSTDSYATWKEDTDETFLDPYFFVLGVKFRWLRGNGFDYAFAEQEYNNYLRSNAANKQGSRSRRVTPGTRRVYPEYYNIPLTDYGP